MAAPAIGQAHGDPVSDYLPAHTVFLPFDAEVDPDLSGRLSETVRSAEKSGYKVRVAVVRTRYDLGTAFSLYGEPQRYAESLGLELSSRYQDHLLVVMPNGFGTSIGGEPDPRGIETLKGLPAPGKDVADETVAATVAIRLLAAASGHVLPASGATGASSQTHDRITIAAVATALVALLAAIVLFRRSRPPSAD